MQLKILLKRSRRTKKTMNEFLQTLGNKLPDILAILMYVLVALKMLKEQGLNTQSLMSYISVDREKIVKDFEETLSKTVSEFATERSELTKALEQAKKDAEESITSNAEQIAVLTTQMNELLQENAELKELVRKSYYDSLTEVKNYDKEV